MGIGGVSVSGDRWEEVCLWWRGEKGLTSVCEYEGRRLSKGGGILAL